MKNIVIATVLLSGMIFAQNNNKPKLEAVGDLVKRQLPFMIMVRYNKWVYKNGKLQGEWISYDSNGYKNMATYDNGQKSENMVFLERYCFKLK
jgi:hypothetical protein